MEVEKTRQALENNAYRTHFVKTKEEALALVIELTKDDVTFSNGGSESLKQSGIIDYLKTKGENYFDRDKALSHGFEAYFKMMQKANTVDVFLSSVNAITMNGYLYNTDANGNRVSCIMFGPKKVIIVASVNKIVLDEAAAIERVRQIAGPLNARRLNLPTPCVSSGKCEDCSNPRRICNISVFHKRSMIPGRIQIIFVAEKLGY